MGDTKVYIVREDIYKIDRISNSTKVWEKIHEKIQPDLDNGQKVLLDFKGIKLIDIWQNAEFRKLFRNPLVYVRVYDCPKVEASVNAMCIIDGLVSGRIINVAPEIVTVDAKKLKIEKRADDLADVMITQGNELVLDVSSKYDQLGSDDTAAAIELAILKYFDEHRDARKSVVIVTGNLVIQDNVMKKMADSVVKLNTEGIHVEIDSDIESIVSKLRLYIHKASNKQYTDEEKARMFSRIKPKTVGLLSYYKCTRASDDFGRSGKGEVVSCRAAMFMGVRRVSGELCVVFMTFNSNTLCTKAHWSLEKDGEEHPGLYPHKEVIRISDIGLEEFFLGRLNHFCSPVQVKDGEKFIMYDTNEDGKLISTYMTTPERIKAVLDDFNIDYNVEALDKAIEQTKLNLGIK